MRHAAYSDVATVQLEHNVEVLERKLIGLRAEIDAILSQLAVEKVAAPAVEWVPTPEPQAPEATVEAPEPALAAPAQAEIEPEPSLSGDGSSRPVDDMPMHGIDVDQPSAVATLSEAEHEAPSSEILASDSRTPVDACAQTTAVVAAAETAAPQAEMQFDPAREAAMPIAPAASMEPGSSHPAPAEPAAAAAPQPAVDGVPAPAAIDAAAPAAAQVISLEMRRRKAQGVDRNLGAHPLAAPARNQDRRLDHCPACGGNDAGDRRQAGCWQRPHSALDLAAAIAHAGQGQRVPRRPARCRPRLSTG